MDASRYHPVFLEEARQHLDAARALAAEVGDRRPADDLVSGLARHLHALKGLAACLRYRTMTGLAHAAEETLASWKTARGVVPARALLLDALGAYERMLEEVERPLSRERWRLDILLAPKAQALDVLDRLAVLGTVLGTSPSYASLARGSRARRLSVVMSSVLEPEDLAAGLARVRGLSRFFLEPATVPFGRIARPLVQSTTLLARSLGKHVRFDVDGRRVRLDRRRISALLEALLHVLRNAVDHGIEPPRERLAQGKNRCGVVRIRAERRGGEVRVRVEDDGRGFDIEQMARVGPRPRARVGDEISGRGVGLSAARRALAALGGRLVIRARPGKGARVEIRLLALSTDASPAGGGCAPSRARRRPAPRCGRP